MIRYDYENEQQLICEANREELIEVLKTGRPVHAEVHGGGWKVGITSYGFLDSLWFEVGGGERCDTAEDAVKRAEEMLKEDDDE